MSLHHYIKYCRTLATSPHTSFGRSTRICLPSLLKKAGSSSCNRLVAPMTGTGSCSKPKYQLQHVETNTASIVLHVITVIGRRSTVILIIMAIVILAVLSSISTSSWFFRLVSLSLPSSVDRSAKK